MGIKGIDHWVIVAGDLQRTLGVREAGVHVSLARRPHGRRDTRGRTSQAPSRPGAMPIVAVCTDIDRRWSSTKESTHLMACGHQLDRQWRLLPSAARPAWWSRTPRVPWIAVSTPLEGSKEFGRRRHLELDFPEVLALFMSRGLPPMGNGVHAAGSA